MISHSTSKNTQELKLLEPPPINVSSPLKLASKKNLLLSFFYILFFFEKRNHGPSSLLTIDILQSGGGDWNIGEVFDGVTSIKNGMEN
ncbi:hypothetical protein CEXT_172651 [Caerostris extrusa]|uniref:Uncharacterized protein n=1 Tax=Caerostris extrusa TaxID=172846 RepID=A0AAV4PVY8_CAEEX|nr:hypothetical protein CEXT_172651 [Caerostris extrusa]